MMTEIGMEILAHEIKHRGVNVLRYHIVYPTCPSCESVADFYRNLAEKLRDYAEEVAKQRAALLENASRSERAAFREMMIRTTPCVMYSDDRYVSIRLDFIAADRDKLHRFLRLAHTFELATGLLTSPAEFLPRSKRRKIPSEDFYLSEKGPVFVVNRFDKLAASLSQADAAKLRPADCVEEMMI